MAAAKTDMAKPRNDVSVKLDARVYRYAKSIAAWKDKGLAEYISQALAHIVEKDWKEMTGSKIDLANELQEGEE